MIARIGSGFSRVSDVGVPNQWIEVRHHEWWTQWCINAIDRIGSGSSRIGGGVGGGLELGWVGFAGPTSNWDVTDDPTTGPVAAAGLAVIARLRGVFVGIVAEPGVERVTTRTFLGFLLGWAHAASGVSSYFYHDLNKFNSSANPVLFVILIFEIICLLNLTDRIFGSNNHSIIVKLYTNLNFSHFCMMMLGYFEKFLI